ncbi:hypothetical protein Tco_0037043, partial [Tanacetum coccineum]
MNETLGYLKEYVEKLEIEVPTNLKRIPDKFDELQTNISALTTKVDKLERSKSKIPSDLVALPGQVSSISSYLAKLKVLDELPNILSKVVAAMDRFAHVISSTSQRAGDTSVPSAGQAVPRPITPQTEGEKKKDKGKNAMSQKDITTDEESDSDSDAEKEIKNQKGIEEIAKAEAV